MSGIQDAESSYQLQVTVSFLTNFSQTTHAGLLLLEEFLHGYMAVVGMLVLGNAFENTWLNVSKGVILGANGEWDQHALQNH